MNVADLVTYYYYNTSLNSSAACSNNPIMPPSEKRRLVHIPSSSCYVTAITMVTYKHSLLTGDKSSSDIALSSSTLGDILCRSVVMDHVIKLVGSTYLKSYTAHREIRFALKQVEVFGDQRCCMDEAHSSLRKVLPLWYHVMSHEPM